MSIKFYYFFINGESVRKKQKYFQVQLKRGLMALFFTLVYILKKYQHAKEIELFVTVVDSMDAMNFFNNVLIYIYLLFIFRMHVNTVFYVYLM